MNMTADLMPARFSVTITPALLRGAVVPPPSKSQAHRVLIAAALGTEKSAIENLGRSEDIDATRRCMAALKAPGAELPRLDCGESGSTLRFLIPVALALRGGGVFTGQGRLMERPQEPYFAIFREKGIAYAQQDGVLTVKGQLTPGAYTLPGNVSSQFITGLLYALPLLSGDSELRLTTPLESQGYVDMTLDVLKLFGIQVTYDGDRAFHIPGGQRYQGRSLTIEADWSNAAFWYAAAYLDSRLDIQGLNYDSTQGDAAIGRLYWTLAKPGEAEIDVSGFPDLVPPLSAMAALRGEGQVTRLVNAARLRIKESDRLSAVTDVLTALGAEVEEHADHLVIRGRDRLPGGVTVSGHNDHRIAMMAAIAATNCAAPVTITGAECVRKSYPAFWAEYARLGGQIAVSE